MDEMGWTATKSQMVDIDVDVDVNDEVDGVWRVDQRCVVEEEDFRAIDVGRQ